ncbi:MAG TPA: hypothetical protein VHN10_02335 [Candidatus Acidoferrales bacterium]|jgi:uncharacterized membrane protein|nr:hypothetical protein [Candidatus Acidoferrales bacterium]
MPVIVIVLMFLVLFLLVALAMIVGPFLGLGYALWNLNHNHPQQCVSEFQPVDLKSRIVSRNSLSRR